jgi:arylsulfate sulfotransferase
VYKWIYLHKIEAKERTILNAFKKGTYGIENPLVIQDPYDAVPLTALIFFKTDKPSRITLDVTGKDEWSGVQYTFPGEIMEHEIPVAGLYPDYENRVTLSASYADGTTETNTLMIRTDPLPPDFPRLECIVSEPADMQPGFTFVNHVNNKYNCIIDHNADVRWYSRYGGVVFNRLKNGNCIVQAIEEIEENVPQGSWRLNEINLLGKVFASYSVPYGIHHDTVEMPGGNFLVTANGGTMEDVILELERTTGKIVSDIKLRDIFPEPFFTQKPEGLEAEAWLRESGIPKDWAHHNAIWYDAADDSILISLRNQSMVMKLGYPAGDIRWILAADENIPEEWSKNYLLRPMTKDFKFPNAQHAVMRLSDLDGNADTLDIVLFDNNDGYGRGLSEENKKYSQGIHLRINEKTRTVEQLWAWGKELGQSYYSRQMGDTNYYDETHNYLVTFADIFNSPEINTTTGEPRASVQEVSDIGKVVFQAEFFGATVYRAERMPLYPENWVYHMNNEPIRIYGE